MTEATAYNRDRLGRFGSGNPGRRLGAKGTKSLGFMARVQTECADLAITKLREQIELGNMAAIKVCLALVLPASRLVDIESSDPNAVVDALAQGEISPDEAVRMAQAMRTAGEASDLKELKRQVEELEHMISAVKR